jgi:hypothetical protein
LPPKGNYDPYEFTRRLLTFFLATTICLVLATIYYAIVCFKNMMHGIYVLTVYGLPGQQQPPQPYQPKHNHIPARQSRFNPEFLGYDGYSGSGYTGNNDYTGYSGGGGVNNGGGGYGVGGGGGGGGYAGYNGNNGNNGYNGYNASPVPDEQNNKKSKRASKIAEVQKARLSRRLSID